MKYKKRDLKVRTVTRSVIKQAGEVLNRMNASQTRLQNLILDKVQTLGPDEIEGVDWENPIKLMSKYPDLAKELMNIARESQNNTFANADFTYELFALAVDRAGWTDEEIAEFDDTYAELYDYEDVAGFVNSFRQKLP